MASAPGRSSEQSLTAAAVQALDTLHTHGRQILLVGQSLGTGVACAAKASFVRCRSRPSYSVPLHPLRRTTTRIIQCHSCSERVSIPLPISPAIVDRSLSSSVSETPRSRQHRPLAFTSPSPEQNGSGWIQKPITIPKAFSRRNGPPWQTGWPPTNCHRPTVCDRPLSHRGRFEARGSCRSREPAFRIDSDRG